MSNLFRKHFIIFTVIVLTLQFASPITVSAWGDNSGLPDMRPSYTKADIDAGKLGDTITFNSISDNDPYGDEKNFMSARMYNDTDLSHPWNKNEITVEDGKEYVIRMYVHNNSPKGRNAIAKDTHVFFSIPSDSGTQLKITGFLDSSNATPTEYWDSVVFNSCNGESFHLEPVIESARIYNKGVGRGDDGAKLSDEIITNIKGVLIGFDSLNGEIPGYFEFDAFVTMRVKVIYEYKYTVNTEVRIAGDTDKTWKESVDAKIGDKVEFLIEYRNTSTKTQNHVIVGDILPDNLKYIEGSTKIYNGSHPNGATVERDSIIDDGLIIGSYETNSNAYIRFTAEVVDETFTCGLFTLRNWGRVSVGLNLIQDSADVNVQLTHCPDYMDNKKATMILCIFFIVTILSYTLRQYKHR